MINYLAIVVLYNKKICESKTLTTLIKNIKSLPQGFKLVIWNNGPEDVKWYCDFIDVDIINSDVNRPLSEVYNVMIERYLSKIYCIFDDDTTLNSNYFSHLEVLNNRPPTMLVPKIFCNGNAIYPRKLASHNFKHVYRELFVSSMSGLAFNRDLVTSTIQNQGFFMDSRFAFYGVDTSLFLNLQNSRLKVKFLFDGYLEHDLSSYSELGLSSFRFKERCYDQALMFINYRKYYSYLFIFLESIKSLIKVCQRRDLECLFGLMSIIRTKRHPRCNL